ncbi:MAG: S1 RNA-binding domain-containing protein [Candidatus Diapherotrites archaeon]|nr:S1 RNA-binding domain-containing protein [Candidatus Diapherotrites archaeon]
MPEKNVEMPEPNEIVVCRIKKVLNYGVIVELLEYENVSGFVHISEVASGWVKNIRHHVHENEVRAAKVIAVHPGKNEVDLSFAKVSERQQRNKIEEYNRIKRAKSLLEAFAKKHKIPFERIWEEVAIPLMENFDSIDEGLQRVALKREEATSLIPKEYAKEFIETISKSVAVTEKIVEAVVEIKSTEPNGVNIIRDALIKCEKESEKIEIFYIGAGRYSIRASAFEFKEAKQKLNSVLNCIEKSLKGTKTEFKLISG